MATTTSGTTDRPITSIETVRERAYMLWLQDGSPQGRSLDYWNRAETEVGKVGTTIGGSGITGNSSSGTPTGTGNATGTGSSIHGEGGASGPGTTESRTTTGLIPSRR